MAEESKKKSVKELTVKKLREKGVKPRQEIIELSKEQRKIIKQIKECLKDGPKTIPEIASATGLKPGVATWYVMTLVKYGELVASEEDVEGYYTYSLPEVEEKEEKKEEE